MTDELITLLKDEPSGDGLTTREICERLYPGSRVTNFHLHQTRDRIADELKAGRMERDTALREGLLSGRQMRMPVFRLKRTTTE